MSGIRGKPGALYRYRDGQRVPLSTPDVPGGPVASGSFVLYEFTAEQKRRWYAKKLAEAAQNLQALHRPLKPPARRSR